MNRRKEEEFVERQRGYEDDLDDEDDESESITDVFSKWAKSKMRKSKRNMAEVE